MSAAASTSPLSNDAFYYPFSYSSWTDNGEINVKGTVQNLMNMGGYIPLLSVITGLFRVTYGLVTHLKAENDVDRSIAEGHMIRGITEIATIFGLVLLVIDLCNTRFGNELDVNQTALEDHHENEFADIKELDVNTTDFCEARRNELEILRRPSIEMSEIENLGITQGYDALESTCNLKKLPLELIKTIFLHCGPETTGRLSSVSRMFSIISNLQDLWRSFCQLEKPGIDCFDKPWKKVYQDDVHLEKFRGSDQVFLQCVDKSCRILNVNLDSGVKMIHFKELLMKDYDYNNLNEMRLIFAGKEVENDRSPIDYGLVNQSAMYLVIRPSQHA